MVDVAQVVWLLKLSPYAQSRVFQWQAAVSSQQQRVQNTFKNGALQPTLVGMARLLCTTVLGVSLHSNW